MSGFSKKNMSPCDVMAEDGAPTEVTKTLHRIAASTLRTKVEAISYQLDRESSILAIPADSRTIKVFDQSIQGHTDQFVLNFRKSKV
jgi:predicted methyltransferase